VRLPWRLSLARRRSGVSFGAYAWRHTLTWRKQPCPDVDLARFGQIAFTDPAGMVHTWPSADTIVNIPVDDRGGMFEMRQVTRLLPTRTGSRQAHVLTTRTDLSAGEVLFRMGSRWRLENYFRYARMHFALDAHDSYAASDDDPDRMVPNPAKKTSRDTVNAARARLERVQATTDAALLDWHTPPPGPAVTLTNADHNQITAPLWKTEEALEQARQAHAGTPVASRWGR